jgi:hypothetical protein
VFKYHGSRVPPINRKWVDALMTTANSPGGLLIMREPLEDEPRDDAR